MRQYYRDLYLMLAHRVLNIPPHNGKRVFMDLLRDENAILLEAQIAHDCRLLAAYFGREVPNGSEH